MTFDEVIDLLKKNYKIAQKYEYVHKPLSWALYHTWDEVDKKRETEEIKNRISELQTYKLFPNDDEKYISRDEVLHIIDEKIKECSEWKK